jgi:hypothetical protein
MMDTKTLIAESKARFAHNSAKSYLKEKYEAKLLIAEQGGLWRADLHTISALNSFTSEELVLIDTFGNTIKVDRVKLLTLLTETYQTVMMEWYDEAKELENKR